jgi:hypothetical protein
LNDEEIATLTQTVDPKLGMVFAGTGGYARSRDAPSRNERWLEVIAGKATVPEGG